MENTVTLASTNCKILHYSKLTKNTLTQNLKRTLNRPTRSRTTSKSKKPQRLLQQKTFTQTGKSAMVRAPLFRCPIS
jgi:hypothetical protein